MIHILLTLFLSVTASANNIVQESAFVVDSDKKILKSLTVNKDLTFDHVNSNGFEVYGPKGTLDFLRNHNIPHFDLSVQVANLDNYPSTEEIENMIYDLNKQYPHLTQVIEIGKSVQGRKLLVLKVSDNPSEDETEPEFKYISSMHGDEITGRELMIQYAKELLYGYSTDSSIKSLIDSTEIYIMPSMNPDGSARKMRGNANYVDLNRNFPDFTTSDNQDTPNGRQPETQAVMSFQKGRQFSLSANFHGGAEVVNYAWDTMPAKHPFHDLLVHLSLEYANRATYIANSNEFPKGITNGYEWYEVNNGMQDWSYYWYNDLQFTVELSQSKWPSYSNINYYYAQNRESLFHFAQLVHMGAGFKLNKSDENGNVVVYRIDGGQSKNLGTYKFRNSEFYKVLEPGQYQFEIQGNGFKRNIDVNVREQKGTYEAQYTEVNI